MDFLIACLVIQIPHSHLLRFHYPVLLLVQLMFHPHSCCWFLGLFYLMLTCVLRLIVIMMVHIFLFDLLNL